MSIPKKVWIPLAVIGFIVFLFGMIKLKDYNERQQLNAKVETVKKNMFTGQVLGKMYYSARFVNTQVGGELYQDVFGSNGVRRQFGSKYTALFYLAAANRSEQPDSSTEKLIIKANLTALSLDEDVLMLIVRSKDSLNLTNTKFFLVDSSPGGYNNLGMKPFYAKSQYLNLSGLYGQINCGDEIRIASDFPVGQYGVDVRAQNIYLPGEKIPQIDSL